MCRYSDIIPIHVAIILQAGWIRFAHFAQGLLAGIAAFHLFATGNVEYWIDEDLFANHLAYFNKFYDFAYSFLLVIAIVSVCDSYDLGHIDMPHLYYFWNNRGQFTILLMYMISMILYVRHRSLQDIPILNHSEILRLLYESSWHDIIVIIAWIFDATMIRDHLLLTHLKNILHEWDDKKKSEESII